jgi:chromosome segregation protein
LNDEVKSLKIEITSLKKSLGEYEQENNSLKNKISLLEKEKINYENEIKRLKEEIANLQNELSQFKSDTNKSTNEVDNYLEKINSLNEIIAQNKLEIDSLNNELDQYENESKAMDTEIKRLQNENKSLKKQINELNLIIEKLKLKISEYESGDFTKKETTKNPNELFCELYQKFSNKKLIQYKIEMLIGMYLQKQLKSLEKKYSKMAEDINKYKKRISELTGELHIIKFGKRLPSNLEEYKDQINLKTDEGQTQGEEQTQIFEGRDGEKIIKRIISKRASSHEGITRVIDVGTTQKEFGNAIITTRTTQISYKRKRAENKTDK